MFPNPNKALLLLLIPALWLAASCEKDVTVDLPAGDARVIVEGYIENGASPYVLLSRSTGYFAPFDSLSLINSGIRGALVIIRDGSVADTLVEVSKQYGYLYVSTNLTGTVGKSYSLYVRTPQGEELTAETHCYPPVPLDSTWFKVQPNEDSLGFAWAHLTDPDTLGNVYRWFAKRIGKDEVFIAPIGSVFEDKFINGTSFDFAYNRGELPNSNAEDDNNEEDGYFKVGDTIVVKFCTAGRATFDFWRSAETQISNNGNPFAGITYVEGNVSGGLGIFEAYTPSYDTIYAEK